MSTSKAAIPSCSHLTSRMYSLPIRRLREVLTHVVPNAELGPVEELTTTQLPRLYKLNMSDDHPLYLSYAPSLAVRLLRQEATLLSSEALLLSFVAASQRKPDIEAPLPLEGNSSNAALLMAVIPKLVKHSSNNREMAYPYSIFEPVVGEALSSVSIYLSIPERRHVDRQVGLMVHELASFISPSGTFGTTSRVLPDLFNPQSPAAPRVMGSEVWSEAFNVLLEGILRDGEDMNVLLPYEGIRAHFQRLSWYLDAVTQPRLVVLDAGSDSNIIVDRGAEEPLSAPPEGVRLKGLRSWSHGVFGDPLICDAFESPGEDFLAGWQAGEKIIEDEANAGTRLLLYRCYRACVSVVVEHYRPQADSSRKELEGRRALTTVLAELDKVDVVPSDVPKRARSSSDGMASSKRQRIGEKVV
ncbi:hypothetical protein BGZ60DRAFT_530353 [Tricladium varicosporioides]|nr:hypothetical protein BGZ60DRAFT_530353 [Hymenoscyphus varicosporioides]